VALRWLLGVIVTLVLLAYGLYPVRGTVEGVGTIEPVFEDLILITSHFSGIVTPMRVELLQESPPARRCSSTFPRVRPASGWARRSSSR
jgi:hypothetical protein